MGSLTAFRAQPDHICLHMIPDCDISVADAVAATCQHLRALALKEDTLWHQKFLRDFPGVSELLTEQTSPWIAGQPWRQRYAGICKGNQFKAHVSQWSFLGL